MGETAEVGEVLRDVCCRVPGSAAGIKSRTQALVGAAPFRAVQPGAARCPVAPGSAGENGKAAKRAWGPRQATGAAALCANSVERFDCEGLRQAVARQRAPLEAAGAPPDRQ
ncbi:hypothetical protein Efla_003197 [Eimeria flavescens]